MRASSMVLGASLLLPAVALAAAFGHKKGSESWTEVAGQPGAARADAVTSADYYGLQIVKMWQYGGRPCALYIEQSTFATRALSRLDSLRVCEPSGGAAWKQADVGSGKYVTAVAVCTGKGKDDTAVRGIELWGSVLDDSGAAKPAKAGVRLEFPECKKWHPKRSCPVGTVATGIRAAHDRAAGITGLSLRCHELEPRGK